MIGAFLFLVAVTVWILVSVGFMVKGVESDRIKPRLFWLVVAFLVFTMPLSYVLGLAEDDAHAGVLCLRGHQTWLRTGKTTTKHWACDEWEAR